MSSAEQPDIATSTRPPPHLGAVVTSRGLSAAPGSWLRIDPQGTTGSLPPAGQPGHGLTASLRWQSAWVVHDREGHPTGLFEIICPDCGDHPYLDYEGISPRLQKIRGPYTLEAGLDAYAEHLGLVPWPHDATAGRPGAGEATMSPGPGDPDVTTRLRPATRSGVVPAPHHADDGGDSWLGTAAGSVVTLPPPGKPGHGGTARLRRQRSRLVDGQAEDGYTDVFEVICPSCGDNPDLDYSEVPPWLQSLRGPHAIQEGVAAYLEHIGG
jgi:hypothetical protein